jgi:hypothetical protein
LSSRAASADSELTEEIKQEGEQTENCGKEKENDQQKANVQNEDHPLLDLVPITPPFDLSRFAYYIIISLNKLHIFASAFY